MLFPGHRASVHLLLPLPGPCTDRPGIGLLLRYGRAGPPGQTAELPIGETSFRGLGGTLGFLGGAPRSAGSTARARYASSMCVLCAAGADPEETILNAFKVFDPEGKGLKSG